MPSPFPGMDPYLETSETWQDFHQSFIPMLRELLSEQVRSNYLVKIEEHVFVHELPAEQGQLISRANVNVAAHDRGANASAAAVEAPAYGLLPTAIDVERHAFLEVRDRRDRTLVSVVELLSPTNKQPGPDREQYLARRLALLSSAVHVIEIDLLRSGPRLPLESMPACDYCVLVSRYEERPRVAVWPIGLRERLPEIPVPLREPDRDARVDLQRVLDRVYDAAGYVDYVYANTPRPPLSAGDADWARERLASRGS